MTIQHPRTFSAPGKALLAGGYLVLDPVYKSYVIALSSRMYASTSIKPTASNHTTITISSPQFREGKWTYAIVPLSGDDNQLIEVNESNNRKNPFVESTLFIVLNYLNYDNSPLFGKSRNIQITMFSDSSYHSQLDSIPKSSSNGSKTFLYHDSPITRVPKTGLGSSAGLVTSLTAALLSCFVEDIDVHDMGTLNKIHNLSQVAHCLAQGKVGSGFDIASATFGSIIYRRFKPDLINNLISNTKSTAFRADLQVLIDETDWNFLHDKCNVPRGIKLLMGDIKSGSETPKLVSTIQNWKKENPEESLKLYTDLNKANNYLIDRMNNLNSLSVENPTYYNQLLDVLQNSSGASLLNVPKPSKDIDISPLTELIQAIQSIRFNLRLLTAKSTASVEPIEQTNLLNACETINGVIGGVVPGAGGYDAICLLVRESCIGDLIKETESNLSKYNNVEWLNLREEDQGLIEQDTGDFVGLL